MCRPSISVLVGVVCVLFQMVAGWMVWGQSMQFAVRLLHRYCWSLAAVLVTQLCPTLCDPMGCRSPGSSVHGILQARILGWVAIPFSRGSSRPRDQTRVLLPCKQFLYYLSHQGSTSKKVRYLCILPEQKTEKLLLVETGSESSAEAFTA